MKDLRQSLVEDIAADEELAGKLGYEATEQDLSDAEKSSDLDLEQLEDVAGGIFGLGAADEENNELWCIMGHWRFVGEDTCPKSPTKLHRFKYAGYIFEHKWYKCVYCRQGTYLW